jgi:basic membrane protein A and related proteins
MHTSTLHSTSIQRIWHILVLAALCFTILLPSPLVVHANVNTKIGLVTALPLGDGGYNDLAYQGLVAAEAAPPTGLGADGTVYQSANDTEYAAKLQACAQGGNALCLAVGFTMADAVAAAAAAYPAVNFAILDNSLNSPLSNLRGITFNEKQAGYLAGALAGKMTSTNVIGAVGGMSIPPVIAFLAGYQNGAQCANSNVSVLLNYTGTFTDPSLGADTATDMIASNADVIFGAAGETGNGAILYSAQDGVWSIGVDSDQYLSVFGNGAVDGADKLLSSAMKRLDNAVYHTVQDQLGGTFSPGNVTYSLSNGGVGLAPYHETDTSIPPDVKTYINTVTSGLTSGSINLNETCRAHTQIGLVTDTSGANDGGWNSMAYQGLLDSQVAFGITPLLYEPSSDAQYASKLGQCASDGNDLCFAVGFTMTDAVVAAARLHPATHFAILDVSPDSPPSNLRGILFNVKQAAYLAGALAAKMTTSNTIGSIGGMQIPAVVDFMDGYQNGAQCANRNANVLASYAGTFVDPALGGTTAADMMSRGADVIFAPAGPTGTGAIQYSAQHGTWSIGVDTDQYVTVFGDGAELGANKMLTSVMKNLDVAVHNTIVDELADNFTSGIVTYGLDTGGVGLAPYHDAAGSISPDVQTYLDTLRNQIIAGDVDVNYPCRPRFHAEIVENDVIGMDWKPGWSVNLTIDAPGTSTGVDFSDTKAADVNGIVAFNNLGGIQLAPNMIVTMSHTDTNPLFNVTKVLTVTNLTVTHVDPALDTVSGTGPEGAWINVQRCDNIGCSWRRWVQVVGGQWLADFKVAGPGDDEKMLLDILPGMTGEAIQPDEDADHTDYQWHAPDPVTVSYRSNGGQDGWVLETGEKTNLGGLLNATNPTFMLGDDATKKQYRAILSFTTSGLPDDAVITSTKLTLRRQAIKGGGNPFTMFQGLLIDVRKGYFGTTNTLQPMDFQAAASKPGLGPFKPAPVGTVYTVDLPGTAYPYINKQLAGNGLTQLRLRFKLDDNNNAVANFISLYSGNHGTASYRPTLVITYYRPN